MPNEENERKLEKLHKELMRLEQQLYEILTSNQLSESIKILEKIAFTIKLIKTNDDKGEKTETEVFKSLRENYKNFAKSIQHLSANEYESVLNIIKKTQQINNKIITLGKDNSDLQDENVESIQEENVHQSTYQISKVIEEQKVVEERIDQQKSVVEESEEEIKQDINNISNETTQEEFFIDWEYVKNLGLMGQWEKRAEYFENLASKIKIASNSSNKNLVPVPIWEDRSPALIDERYAEIFKTCYIEYEKAKKCDELSKSQPNDTKEKIQEESFEGIDFKKMGSMSLQKRKHYLLVYMSKIIKNPAKIENPYLISFGDKVYTIDKKYAEVFNQCKDLIIQIQKEETRAKIEEISKIAEDYVNLKNKIMHRISISNMDHYNYESQKDKEEMEAIINDVNKYLHLQGRLKYFMKDPKDHHLLETPFDVDKLFATYEKFNKNNVKLKEQKNLNTSRVPIRTEKFKINWKEIARLSIKDKIETLEKAMIAMINAPKENTTSVNVDDISYIINKKDERVFNKCYKEYKKAYFPVYNNNFSAKFSVNLSQMIEEPVNNEVNNQIPKETKKFKIDYKKVSRMSIKEKVDYFGKLMLEIQNVPKENTISINIDDINYVINKKDEKVFRNCCSEYKKANLELQEEIEEQNIPSEYFEASTNEEETENKKQEYYSTYNNGFVGTIDYAQLIKMQSQNDFGEKEVKQNTSEVINKNNINPFQRQDKILSDIINKIGYGIKVIKVLPASLSRTIMKRVQLGTVKVKAGTYDMLDENIYREENRYGR